MEENKDMVGIVLVNYNGAKVQNDCIRSLLASDYPDFKIIIVDNASKDNSLEMLKEFDDERILLIKESENWGVAKGNNIGIRKSIELGCSHTLLLNNDTEVAPDFLFVLLEAKEPIAVPKIYYYGSNKLWYAGGKLIDRKGRNEHLYYKEEDKEGLKFVEYCDYAPTCCMLIDNEVFDEVGMMDEKYFLYHDDVDFCYRLKKGGYRIKFCPGSVIYHKVSSSSGGEESPISIYYCNRNRFYYIKKFKMGCYPYFFSWLSRKIKIVLSRFKGTDEWYYIKEAMKDYKAGKMYRRDNLSKPKKEGKKK